MNSTVQNLEDLKVKVVNMLFILASIITSVSYVLVVFRALEFGLSFAMITQMLIYIFLITITILRNKIHLKIKIYIFIFIAMSTIATGIYDYGFLASGKIYLAILPLLIGFIVDIRRAMLSLLLLISTFIVFAILFTNGILKYNFDVISYIINPKVWAIETLAIIITTTIILYVSNYFMKTLKDNYSLIENQNKELLEHRDNLENIVAERTNELNSALQKIEESNIELKSLNNELANESKELLKSEQQLKEVNQTKNIFFSIIAHDLRTPFVALLNNAELLENHYEDMNNDERKKFIATLKNASKNTYSLLENLLIWSSAQMGTIQFVPLKINLYDLFLKNKYLLQLQADSKNLMIDIKPVQELEIFADSEMLNTVVRNLLNNAIKFTPRGGRIEMGTADCKQSDSQNNHTCFYVKDNGIGIDPKIVTTLFDINHQGARKGTEGEPSSRLGLVLCKEFIDRHNGKIWLESELSVGTTVFVALPNTETIS